MSTLPDLDLGRANQLPDIPMRHVSRLDAARSATLVTATARAMEIQRKYIRMWTTIQTRKCQGRMGS